MKTSKGNELSLMKLKGKDYMMVAQRLIWLVDDHERYTINTEFLKLETGNNDKKLNEAVARTTITLLDSEGNVTRSAVGTKRERESDFSDYIEKAETGSLGRALAMIGMGTQHAQQDLDEGERLADAPVAPKSTKTVKKTTAPKKRSFKPQLVKEEKEEDERKESKQASGDDWL